MAYSEQVFARATEKLEAGRQRARDKQAALRRNIYQEIPALQELDRALQRTMPKVVALTFQKTETAQAEIARLRQENQRLQQQRRELLIQGGYEPAALEDKPACALCADSGWQGARMCSCLQALCQQEQIRELSALFGMGEQSFEDFRLDYYEERPWPEFGRSPRENMQKILAFCRGFAGRFSQHRGKNLFFYGAPGLGKTYLSACIAREVAQGGSSVVYDTAGNIFARFEEQKFSREQEDVRQAKDLTRKYLRCDLLILDDLGSEMTTPFVQSALYLLVNTRMVEGRSTIISSNYSLDDLRGRYTPQILSRLEGEYEPLPFFGQDIRIQKKG